MRKFITNLLYWGLRIFWRLKWIKGEKENENGWYLVKRRWVWVLFSPVILLCMFAYAAWGFYFSLSGYTMHWVHDEKKVLTRDEYRYIFTSLMS